MCPLLANWHLQKEWGGQNSRAQSCTWNLEQNPGRDGKGKRHRVFSTCYLNESHRKIWKSVLALVNSWWTYGKKSSIFRECIRLCIFLKVITESSFELWDELCHYYFLPVFAGPAAIFSLTFQKSLVMTRIHHAFLPGSRNSPSKTVQPAFIQHLL